MTDERAREIESVREKVRELLRLPLDPTQADYDELYANVAAALLAYGDEREREALERAARVARAISRDWDGLPNSADVVTALAAAENRIRALAAKEEK